MTTNPAPSLETRFEQLLELVQAQQSRIEAQQSRMETQQTHIEAQQSRMETQQTHIEAQQTRITELETQQSRITELEARLASSPLPTQTQATAAPAHQGRRRFLQRVAGLALVSGVGASVALARPTTAEAKLTLHPTGQWMDGRVGALLQVPGAAAPIGGLPTSNKYGLIVTSDSTLDLSTLTINYDIGVYSYSAGTGVCGITNTGTGVYGSSNTGIGMYGYSSNNGSGVVGNSSSGNGIYGTSSSGHGVGGNATSGIGVGGASTNNYGVAGTSTSSYGVFGASTNSYGVYGQSTNSYAGYFAGNVQITGALSKASGTFKIDHPLDPAHKYLSHSFVESPDMLNIYNGNVILDANGEAIIELPTWFEALNRDFRYQLTAIGQASPDLFIAEEIANNRFKIAGGKADQRVSWLVTGIRQDAWANANRVQVEEDKTEAEQGKYLHPEAFGLPREGNSIAEHHIPDVPPAPPAPPSDKGIGEK
ncbi:MAG: hypothetical protein HXX20_19595 [Chloroflexi bacterium]|nr:hypothetical protein [Chloroflexota bacterium]